MSDHKIGDIWYRYFTLTSYDPSRYEPEICCIRYKVVKVTAASVWLQEVLDWCEDGAHYLVDDDARFLVGKNSRSSRAKPTRELAWESYLIRTSRRISHLKYQLDTAELAYRIAKERGMPEPGKAGGGRRLEHEGLLL